MVVNQPDPDNAADTRFEPGAAGSHLRATYGQLQISASGRAHLQLLRDQAQLFLLEAARAKQLRWNRRNVDRDRDYFIAGWHRLQRIDNSAAFGLGIEFALDGSSADRQLVFFRLRYVSDSFECAKH